MSLTISNFLKLPNFLRISSLKFAWSDELLLPPSFLALPNILFSLTFSPIIIKSSESFLSSSMSITSRKMAYKSTIQWFMLIGQKHVVNKQKPNIYWKRHNKSKTLNNNWVVGELCNAYPFPLFDQLNWGWRINLYVANDSLHFKRCLWIAVQKGNIGNLCCHTLDLYFHQKNKKPNVF